MPVSAEITSVDTIQIKVADEAFASGNLLLPTEPSDIVFSNTQLWGDNLINLIIVSVCTIMMIFLLGRYVHLFPYILEGVLRPKPIITLEDSVRLTRDRNYISFVSLPVIGTIVSQYDMYNPMFIHNIPMGYRTLAIIGVLALYIAIRRVFILIGFYGKVKKEYYDIANDSLRNFAILLGSVMLTTTILVLPFRLESLTVRNILFYEILCVFAIFLLRRTQILSNGCSHFTAFLYLCALEILPAAILVVSTFIL